MSSTSGEWARDLQGWLLQKLSRTPDCSTNDGSQITIAVGPCLPITSTSSQRYTYESTTTDANNFVTIQFKVETYSASSSCASDPSYPPTITHIDYSTRCSPTNLISWSTNKTYSGVAYSYIPGAIQPLPTSGGWGLDRNFFVDSGCQGIPFRSEYFPGAYSYCQVTTGSSTISISSNRQCQGSKKMWNYYENAACQGPPAWTSQEPTSQCLGVISNPNPNPNPNPNSLMQVVSYYEDSCYEGIPITSTPSIIDKANPLNLPPGIIATLAFIPFLLLFLGICYILRQRCCPPPKPMSSQGDEAFNDDASGSPPDFTKEGNSGFSSTSETSNPL